MEITDTHIYTEMLKNIEQGNNVLSNIGFKILKNQMEMDQQIINMLISNQPQQVTPKSPNSTFEYIA
ncbi:MAG: hypothetical protein GXX85_07770 [Ignavibacteria bacterium]|nr:hypothetical protein [Ignavibacteria bacterium]